MKIRLALIGIAGFTLLTVAAPRIWIFKQGGKFEGDYVSSGTTTVVVNQDGTNYFLSIASLSTNDQVYVAKRQLAQRQVRLDAETNQMISAGMMEYTAKLIENFPEKAESQRGWMDAEFEGLDSSFVDFPEVRLGFTVEDKNGDSFYYCYIEKTLDIYSSKPNPLVPIITNLKRGDKVRLVGSVGAISPAAFINSSGDYRRYFKVERVEMIETAAEKKLIADAAESQP